MIKLKKNNFASKDENNNIEDSANIPLNDNDDQNE